MELKENKNNKKNYIFWIMWILGIYFFTMIVLSIEIDDKTIYAWKEWFNTFKITGLVVIDILFSITMVILSIIFCVIAKKKINAWDGYDKDAQLNLDKYLNGASLVIVFLIYVGAIFTAIICDGGIE